MPRWSAQANDIFLAAIEIAGAGERLAYVQRACGDDAELREAVEQLLAAADRASMAKFLETPPDIAAHDTQRSTESPGTIVGSYKLLEIIGEGGFGTVYRAEQQQPVQRQVAVKIIKPGMDSARVIARFEAERQALAVMDHPNIAKVHDAGTTDAGRPYFVMELVSGKAITNYCDDEQLALAQRLELFVQVCQAVQHAHQKGVIHRDLKPSNILVSKIDDRPIPKVIDFGVAKAVNPQQLQNTVYTQQGELVGTLEYMAPEQAELGQHDVDTRADIYSLGVILYELLAGSPPFTAKELRSTAFDQMLRMIREVEPAKPSTRLSTDTELPSIAARRKIEPHRLRKLVHGELDWIVMKALEKERSRRYETTNGLATDLLRYLSNEPVSAGPPSKLYRVGKFIRRHRAGVAASLAMFVLLAAGIVGTTLGLLEARKQRDEARTQKLETERANQGVQAVNDFLTGELLGAANPRNARGRQISVVEALDTAAAAVKESFADRPLIEAEVRNTLAITYHSLGRADVGLPHAQSALEIRRRLLGNEHADTLKSMNNLGVLLRTLGRADETEVLWREAAETGRRVFGPADPKTLTWTFNLAHIAEDRGKLSDAEQMYREVLQQRRAALGEDHEETLVTANRLGGLLMELGRFAEAEPMLISALAGRRRTLGADHPETLISINDLGMLYENLKRFDECERLYREAMEGYRRVMGPEHPFTLVSLSNFASLLTRRGRPSEAEPYLREAYEVSLRNAGPTNPRTLMFLANLGTTVARQGKFAEAEKLLLEADAAFASAQGIPPSRRERVAEELVKLYIAWDTAEPGKGFDEKARQWRAKLPASQPTTMKSF